MLIRTSGILVPKDHEQYRNIVKDLTRPVYQWNGDVSFMKFYEDLGSDILIPRFYPVFDEVFDSSEEGVDVDIEDFIVPRNERQKKSIDFLSTHTSGVLRLEPGSGKAQPENSLVMTPNGWVKLSDINIGDKISCPEGKKYNTVIGIYPQGKKDVYRVTFSDNTFTECTLEHLWKIKTRRVCKNKSPKWEVLSLKQIKEKYLNNKRNRPCCSIPMTRPVEFIAKRVDIDPYFLGCLIGDGELTTGNIRFTSSDNYILRECKKSLKKMGLKFKKTEKYDYNILIESSDKENRACLQGSFRNILRKRLNELGLLYKKSNEKFIPDIYKLNSVKNRISLLRGLMDTDGYVSPKSSRHNDVSFTSTSERLCGDVKFIVESLGGKAKIYEKKTKYEYKGKNKTGMPAFVVDINLPNEINPFNLPRKSIRYENVNKYPPNRLIKNIEYVGSKKCVCIKVDSDSGLYITNNFIVTHNTVIAIASISRIKKKTIIFAHKTELLNQWKSELLKFTNLTENDIGRLTTLEDKYEEVLEKKIILSTPHIISIAHKKNNEGLLKAIACAGIGVCFIDECHVGIGPEEFSKSSIHLNCRRTYGLSATPIRSDGNDDLIKYHLGDVTYFPPIEGERINPKIMMIRMPFHIFEGGRVSNLMWSGKFNFSRYWTTLSKNEDFSKKVATLVLKAYNQGRTIMVLSNRVEGLINIAKHCGLPKSAVGFFTPGALSRKKQIAKLSDTLDLKTAFKEKRVVFSTYGAGRDGNSRDDLDCLIMCVPTSNVEQAVGRIQRSMDGKKQPIVIDIIDTQSPLNKSNKPLFETQAKTRKAFYLGMGWEVDEKTFKD